MAMPATRKLGPITAASLIAIAAALLALSSCTSTDGAGSPSATGAATPEVPSATLTIVPGAAILDEEHTEIHLPLDEYTPSTDDRMRLQRAEDITAQTCLAKSGYDVTMPNVLDFDPSPIYQQNFFGPWTDSRAAAQGYGLMTTPLQTAQTAFEQGLSEKASKALVACLDEPEVEEFALAADDVTSTSSRIDTVSWGIVEQTKEYATVYAAYRTCMTDQGYVFGPDEKYSPGMSALADPDSASDGPSEQEVDQALDEVECKTSTGFTQTFADIVAAYQIELIAEDEAALVAEKADLDEQLAHANELIAAHPGD